MGRPQPGQKAAVSGIWAAQCGHAVRGTLVWSIVRTISKPEMGGKCANPSRELTASPANSMFRANFSAKLKPSLAPGGCMAQLCEACGNTMTADDKFCRVCGRVAPAGSAATSAGG